MNLFRMFAYALSATGVCMLVLVLINGLSGELAAKYFPEISHELPHHVGGMLLALPVPLHVIFIGLIIQKKHLSPRWARFAWIGISSSGVWLGIALALRLFVFTT